MAVHLTRPLAAICGTITFTVQLVLCNLSNGLLHILNSDRWQCGWVHLHVLSDISKRFCIRNRWGISASNSGGLHSNSEGVSISSRGLGG